MPLTPPPLDGNDEVVPHDHEEILDEDGVLRRISEHHLTRDEDGSLRVSSMAFTPSSHGSKGLSVDLKNLIEEAGIDPIEHVTTPQWMGCLELRAGDFRSEGLWVGFHPLEGNPFHGEAWGTFSKSTKKRLLRVSSWLVEIEGVELQA